MVIIILVAHNLRGGTHSYTHTRIHTHTHAHNLYTKNYRHRHTAGRGPVELQRHFPVVFPRIPVYTHIFMHTYICLYMYMCGQVELQRYFPVVFPRIPVYTHIHTYTYVYVHIHVCVSQCDGNVNIPYFPPESLHTQHTYVYVNAYTFVCGPAKLQRHFPVHSLCIHKYAYIHMHMDTCTYMWPVAIATSLSSRFS